MKIRYAITGIKSDGLRHLSFTNWATYHFDNKMQAQCHLQAIKDNSPHNLYLLGKQPRVDEIECYDSGEAMRTIL